jgi:hypothetical protein
MCILVISIDIEFHIDIGDDHIDIESFYGLEKLFCSSN